MLIGYARVSTIDQNLDLQLDALKNIGCEKLFEDKISGSTLNRPGLTKALEDLRKGDTIKQQFFCKFTFHLLYITRSYLNKQHQ